MPKISTVHKTAGILIIRLGLALTLLASLIGFMAASASAETWWPLGDGTDADVYALSTDSAGNLYAGGDFATAGGATVNYIAKWDGSAWSPMQSGINDSVRALAIDWNEAIHAGGIFTSARSVPANRMAAWGSLPPGPPVPTPTGLPPNSIVPSTDNPQVCPGESSSISISLTDVTALFGYQFIVHYDPNLVDATAAFMNTFFDTRTNAIIPPDWNAVCASGACKFTASLVEPAAPLNGTGIVAQIRLNGKSSGTFDVTISDDILTDRDSQPITHAVHSLRLSPCSYASLSGTVSLQGRSMQIEAGQVTLTDLGGKFGSITIPFDPVTCAFSFDRVKVLPGGSNYQIEAMHGLYLGNRTTQNLRALEAFSVPPTRLQGGDANNDGLIDIGDLTCIGGSFGSAAVICEMTGSSDINVDGVVDILDLVLVGGNHGLASPGDW